MQSVIEQYRQNCDIFIRNIGIGINSEIIRHIEKELFKCPGDVISLLFLLYNNPDIALQQIAQYRLEASSSHPRSGLLLEWFHIAQTKATWKQEFLECLLICQLYSVVRKMGFPVPTLKKYFQPVNLQFSIYVNPIKKVLYKVCEDMNIENLIKLKKSLQTYDIHTDTEIGELIILELETKKFIKITECQYDKTTVCDYDVENLTRIIEKLPGLQAFASALRSAQDRMNIEPLLDNEAITSTPTGEPSKVDASIQKSVEMDSMDELFVLLNELSFEVTNKLKVDSNQT